MPGTKPIINSVKGFLKPLLSIDSLMEDSEMVDYEKVKIGYKEKLWLFSFFVHFILSASVCHKLYGNYFS